jgi:hypothetical protein
MADLKHVGRIKDNGRKCIVVFRTLPGDAFSALVVMTEALSESYHDSIISLVESNAAQVNPELSEVLARAVFSDGSTMLPSLHVKGLLTKVPTASIEMIPNPSVSILLSELNQLIAEQKGISVQDLALQPDAPKTDVQVKEIASASDISPKTNNTDPLIDQNGLQGLSDEDIAKKYRSDADRLSKEAAHLRRLAEELIPTKKKVAVVK